MTADLLAHNLVAHWLQAGLVTGVAGLGIAVLRLRRPGFLLRYWQAVLLLLLVAPWIQPWQPVAAAPAADLTPISGTGVRPGIIRPHGHGCWGFWPRG